MDWNTWKRLADYVDKQTADFEDNEEATNTLLFLRDDFVESQRIGYSRPSSVQYQMHQEMLNNMRKRYLQWRFELGTLQHRRFIYKMCNGIKDEGPHAPIHVMEDGRRRVTCRKNYLEMSGFSVYAGAVPLILAISDLERAAERCQEEGGHGEDEGTPMPCLDQWNEYMDDRVMVEAKGPPKKEGDPTGPKEAEAVGARKKYRVPWWRSTDALTLCLNQCVEMVWLIPMGEYAAALEELFPGKAFQDVPKVRAALEVLARERGVWYAERYPMSPGARVNKNRGEEECPE